MIVGMGKLTHADDRGRASMVDVSDKPVTRRRAVASGKVRMSAEAFAAVEANRVGKGDALGLARIAGICAAKRTDEWIPLCHSVPLDRVAVEVDPLPAEHALRVTATACATARTGVEMEALVAVSAACLTLYDMAKALDRGIVIEEVRLCEKSGGRSGTYRREAP